MDYLPPPRGPRAARADQPRLFVGFRTTRAGLLYVDQRAEQWACNRSEAIRRILADHATRTTR